MVNNTVMHIAVISLWGSICVSDQQGLLSSVEKMTTGLLIVASFDEKHDSISHWLLQSLLEIAEISPSPALTLFQFVILFMWF